MSNQTTVADHKYVIGPQLWGYNLGFNMTGTTDTQEIFIRQYHTALESGLTLDQFADFLEILPSSVIRKQNRLKQNFGLVLQPLPTDNGGIEIEMPSTWDNEELLKTHKKVDWDLPVGSKLVITSAQNATPVNKPFLKTILSYCKKNNARLVVIPYRYKNPTSIFHNSDQGAEWWDKAIEPYLCQDAIRVCDGLQIIGPLKVQPTATNPLSGLDTITGLDSAIIGHPKVQLLTVPTPSQQLPKIMTTTGAVTAPDYTDSKAGYKGEFHHSYAAVIVEVDSDEFHIRHIHSSDDGSFYDLEWHYEGSKKKRTTISGLVTGDSHVEFMDDNVRAATYDNVDSIVNLLKPEVLVYHDVEDFYRRNHHHKNDHLLAYGKHHFGRDNVEEGLQLTADFIDVNSRDWMTNVIVKSNHDEALDRWLKEADPKTDPENSRLYYYLMYNLLKSVESTDTGYSWEDPFKFWCTNPDKLGGLKNTQSTKFLHRDESYTISNIEVGFHGDKGPNGSRGSPKSFAKIGPKTVVGHSHSPSICDSCYTVGLSAKLNLEYVSGPSSWMQTHCIIYPDGKRTLINILNGKWRL